VVIKKSRSEWTKESWATRKKKWPTGISPEGLKRKTNTTELALKGWETRRAKYGFTGLKNPVSTTAKKPIIRVAKKPNPKKPNEIKIIKKHKPIIHKIELSDISDMEIFDYVYGKCPNEDCSQFGVLRHHWSGFCSRCWTDVEEYDKKPVYSPLDILDSI